MPRTRIPSRLFTTLALSFAMATQGAHAQAAMRVLSDVVCGTPIQASASNYVRVVRDINQSSTLSIEGPSWNDTMILGCVIDGANGDGIEIRNVKNLAIVGCTIKNVSGSGIRVRSTGSSDGVRLIDNQILNVGRDGISAAKRVKDNVDHTNLLVAGNVIEDSGRRGRSGLTHGIYSQVSDVTIFGNEVRGKRDGNGISIRSSGLVACNRISGPSRDGKPGIRYFADNYSGSSRTLIIRDNEVRGSTPAVDIREPDSWAKRKTEALVTDIRISNNRSNSGKPVIVHKYWQQRDAVRLVIEGNALIGG